MEEDDNVIFSFERVTLIQKHLNNGRGGSDFPSSLYNLYGGLTVENRHLILNRDEGVRCNG